MCKLIFLTLLVSMLYVSTILAADDWEDYIHLPGKTCAEAPPCPDNRPCVMAPPRCNSGTCPQDAVPTCGRKKS